MLIPVMVVTQITLEFTMFNPPSMSDLHSLVAEMHELPQCDGEVHPLVAKVPP